MLRLFYYHLPLYWIEIKAYLYFFDILLKVRTDEVQCHIWVRLRHTKYIFFSCWTTKVRVTGYPLTLPLTIHIFFVHFFLFPPLSGPTHKKTYFSDFSSYISEYFPMNGITFFHFLKSSYKLICCVSSLTC